MGPLRTSSVPSSRPRQAGFSFIEVLAALVVLAVLVQVTGISMLGVQRAEERARSLRNTRMQLRSLAASHFADYEPQGTWTLETEQLSTPGQGGVLQWEKARLEDPRDRSAVIELHFLEAFPEDP